MFSSVSTSAGSAPEDRGIVATAAAHLPIIMIAFSVFLFIWTIREGRILGQHHMVPNAVDKHETSLSAALSDLGYGLNRGYACYRSVSNTLQAGGMTTHPYFLEKYHHTYPECSLDAKKLDAAIEAALHLENPEKEGIVNNCIFAEDVGYADFGKLAFRWFGYKISSLYAMYYLIMGISLGAFLAYYRRDVPMLMVLLLVQFVFFLVVRSLPVMNYPGTPDQYLQLGTVINGRFMATLGIIPFLHLARCLLAWPGFSVAALSWTAVQATVLGISLHLRGSAAWMFLALFGLAGASVVLALWRERRDLWNRPFSLTTMAGWVKSRWPLIVILAAFLGQKAYIASTAHWIYRTDAGLPHHLVWHSAYLGLSLHPDWPNHPANCGGAGDGIAIAASEKLLEADGIDKGYLIDPLTHGYKAGLHDMLVRQAYLKVVRNHPRMIGELLLWYKPKAVYKYTYDVKKWMTPGIRRTDSKLILACLAIVFGLASFRTGSQGGWKPALGIVGIGVIGSLIPLLWAYPQSHVMSEFVILLGTVAGVGGLCLVRAGIIASRRLASRIGAARWRSVLAANPSQNRQAL